MAIEEAGGSPAAWWVRRSVGIAVGAGGAACALTVLSLAMRAVLDVGGACATGGPFEVANPCPRGMAWLFFGSIFGGMAAALLLAVSVVRGGPSLVALLWPGLFLGVGWNFLDYGYEPPGGDGVVWGWLVCGIVFFVIGAVPLVPVLQVRRLRGLLWGDDGPAGWRSVVPTAPFRPGATSGPVLEWIGPAPGWAKVTASSVTWSPDGTDGTGSAAGTGGAAVDGTAQRDGAGTGPDVVTRLERLSELRRRGALTAEEFEAAKREVLEGR